MSKAAALAATGVGGGGAAVGGYLIFRNDGSGGTEKATEQTQNTPQTDLLENITQPKEATTQLTLNTFKTSDTKNIDCHKDLFTSTAIDFSTPITPPSTLPADSDNKYFGENIADGAQGCLVINYEKKKEDGDK